MVSTVCFCCCLLFSVVFAFDVYIYESTQYNQNKSSLPVHTLKHKYDFVYDLDAKLDMDIRLKNNEPNVKATIYVTPRESEVPPFGETNLRNMIQCNKELCLKLEPILKSKFIDIGIQLQIGTATRGTHIISEGNATLPDQTSKTYLCVKPRSCVLVIDLQNADTTDELGGTLSSGSPSTSTKPQNNVYIYVIPSVLVMCVISIVIYIISVKKCRKRSSDPEHTLELNTCDTTNEVQYADLSFMQGNNQPPTLEEESPYAQIVGVLLPKKY